MGLVGRRLMCALPVVACAMAGPASVALADDVREPLPFLADGAGYPGGRPPPLRWPQRDRQDDVRGTDLASQDPSDVTDRLPSSVPAFPDVTQLVGPIPDVHVEYGGFVTFAAEHPERSRIERLLDAARAGYARDVRVEIVVERREGAAAPAADGHPTAEGVLAAGGELHVDTLTRAGALVFDDARREVSFPARASVNAALVTPQVVVFRVGPRVAFTATPVAGDAFVLDLDLNISRAHGPVVLDEPNVRRAVPVLDVLAVRAAIPLANGRATLVEVSDARIALRVTRAPSAVPDGLAVLALPAFGRALPAARPFGAGARPLPSADDVDDGGDAWDERDGRIRLVPAAWFDAARRAGVRVVPVPPAIAIAEGAPDAIARFLAEVRALRAVAAWDVTAPSVRLPVVAGTSWTCAAGRLEPVRSDVDAEVSERRAAAASKVSFRALGTFAHGRPDGAGLHVSVDHVVAGARDDAASERPLPGRHGSGGGDRLLLDASPARATHFESTLVPGDAPVDGVSVEAIEVLR